MNGKNATIALLACLAGAALPACADSFTDPHTVFYGRIIGTGSTQPFVVTEGALEWTIQPHDAAPVTLETELLPLKNGDFSYRMDVPHDVLALGLETAGGSVPLGEQVETHRHLTISVDGLRATIVGPAGGSFDSAQALRAATYRLDLAVPLAAVDTDGDGLPDWWEDRHGTDKQDDSDSDGDPDGDGVDNLSEYMQGSDPGRDDREPQLLTTRLRAYADGTTGVWLDVADVDTPASNLVYVVEGIPAVGTLYLGGEPLVTGASFTQADVVEGRVTYVHASSGGQVAPLSFGVVLDDGDPAHEPFSGSVALDLYRPTVPLDGLEAHRVLSEGVAGQTLGAAEQQAVANYLLSRDFGYVVWDASPATRGMMLDARGAELPQAICGGYGRDDLRGSGLDDVIVGSAAADCLYGDGGADLFVYHAREDSGDTIGDFRVAEGDAIDLSRVLAGASKYLDDYLRIAADGSNSVIGVNAEGTGGGYSNLALTVSGRELADADIYDLVEGGSLLVGDKVLMPCISVAAVSPDASENGPRTAEVQICRRGDTDVELTVNLLVTGSAQNGVDFPTLPSQITLAAGTTNAVLTIAPYADTLTELAEVVEIGVLGGDGYVVGGSDRTSVTIEDLSPQISVEALEPVAVQKTGNNGVFLVKRGGVIDRSVLIRLDTAGTAEEGVDIEEIPNYLNLSAHETTSLIDVVPKPTAELGGGEKYVHLSIRPDASYVVQEPGGAGVVLVAERLTLADWRARHFPDSPEGLDAFAAGDYGDTGVNNLLRYAFGLDPRDPGTSSGRPQFGVLDGHLTVTYRRPSSVRDIEYRVEVSDDLAIWQGDAARIEDVVLPENEGVPGVVTRRATLSTGEAGKQYMRLRVIYAP